MKYLFYCSMFKLCLFGQVQGATILTAAYPNVQAAINASKPGDTIQFELGKVYSAAATIALASGRIYDGKGATLASLGSASVFSFNALSDVEISNFTFKGNGLSGVSLARAKIHDNKFDLGSNGTGIYVWVSAPGEGCKINPAQCNAAMPITATNVVIERNDFYGTANYTGQNEGIHMRFDTPAPPGPDNGPGKSSGFIFRNNRMRNISRCGGEFQGGSTGSIFEDNVFISPTFSSAQSVNSGSMGLSLAMDASHGTIARKNKIDGAPSRTIDGVGVRNGIEGSGHGYIASDNWIHNCNNGADINNGNDNPSIINNNMAGNASDAVAAQMGGRPYTISNNGPSVALSWDINRPWPLGSVVVPPVCAQDSANNTVVSGAQYLCLGGSSIKVDMNHVSINSIIDMGTTCVSILLYGGKIYQMTAGGDFWVASVNPPKPGTQYLKVADPRPPICIPNVCPTGCASIIVCP